eukprot:950241_1
MGNTYVDNTIQLLEAITEDSNHKHIPQTDKKCYKCYCVPNYIAILGVEYCDVKSPNNKSKPRKLIRNTNTSTPSPTFENESNDTKSQFLPIPAPIMIEESYCSDVSSLDLGIATVEQLPNNNPNINGGNSSYSTIEINNSFDYDEENESINSIENIETEYKIQIQNDIIKHNSLHKYLDQMSGSDNDDDGFHKYSDRDKNDVDNLTDIITNIEPYHEEGVESETEWFKSLKMELNEPNLYLQKRRKHKGKRRKKQKKKRGRANN